MSPSALLTRTVEKLSYLHDLESITDTVAEAARDLTGADGATFVLREDDKCYYVDERAISPLWKGKRFPVEMCISGWCMIHKKIVKIKDVFKDPRIPQDAYRPTFVRSLCMVPIRSESPIGAIGCYWSTEHEPSDVEVKLLKILANCSATALENLELRNAVGRREAEKDSLTDRQRELEFQLHSMAHDLKNPLSTMMGFAELLQCNPNLSPEKKENYASTILATGQRLNRQIEKMLALYRLSNKKICSRTVDLTKISHEVIDALRHQVSTERFEVSIESNMQALGEPDLVRNVIENLVSNAIKYSQKKKLTSIVIGISSLNETEIVFFVRDQGAGFDPAKAGDLFRPLTRLHEQAMFKGTGLGLASVARIIQGHGGRAWAESRLGEGATFFFSLPRAPDEIQRDNDDEITFFEQPQRASC